MGMVCTRWECHGHDNEPQHGIHYEHVMTLPRQTLLLMMHLSPFTCFWKQSSERDHANPERDRFCDLGHKLLAAGVQAEDGSVVRLSAVWRTYCARQQKDILQINRCKLQLHGAQSQRQQSLEHLRLWQGECSAIIPQGVSPWSRPCLPPARMHQASNTV
jgi:hypothetical protein